MLEWFKKHLSLLFIITVTGGLLIYIFGCEPKVTSLINNRKPVTRQELQLELDTIIHTARIRVADLDRQDKLRAIVLQNALVLVQGQPFNPVGLITAVAALYGVTQGASKVTKVVKVSKEKRKVNNV